MYLDLVKRLNCIPAVSRMKVTFVAKLDQGSSLDVEITSILLYFLIVKSCLNVWWRRSQETHMSFLILGGYYMLLLNTLFPILICKMGIILVVAASKGCCEGMNSIFQLST